MLLLTKNPKTGNLHISFDPEYSSKYAEDGEAKTDLLEVAENHSPAGVLATLLDESGYIGNDWYTGLEIGLTEADNIAESLLTREDDEDGDEYESVWYWNNYMIEHWWEVLIREGEVVFTLIKTDLPFYVDFDAEGICAVRYSIDGKVNTYSKGICGPGATRSGFFRFVREELSEGYRYRTVEKSDEGIFKDAYSWKTNLNREIKDQVDVIKFVDDLFNNGESWHFDDDAHEVLWERKVTKAMCDRLNYLNDQMCGVNPSLAIDYLYFLNVKAGNLPGYDE